MATRPFGFPPCATTGIGSLPFTTVAEALAAARDVDIPYVPELIQVDPSERLLERVKKGSEPILRFRLLLDRPRWVKAQLVGPTTLHAVGSMSAEEATQAVMRAAVESVLMLTRDGHQVIFFFDEPSLVNREPIGIEEVANAVRAVGALVGLHCCGQTDWARVLHWPLDFISLDARLSLDALVEERAAFRSFVRTGGALGLGLIPTSGSYAVRELVDSVEASIRSSVAEDHAAPLIARSLLTPACGLGTLSEDHARRISAELKSAQPLLRERFGLERTAT
ncbi:MAG: hypothetical protein QM817_09065 [Archangium sp.]